MFTAAANKYHLQMAACSMGGDGPANALRAMGHLVQVITQGHPKDEKFRSLAVANAIVSLVSVSPSDEEGKYRNTIKPECVDDYVGRLLTAKKWIQLVTVPDHQIKPIEEMRKTEGSLCQSRTAQNVASVCQENGLDASYWQGQAELLMFENDTRARALTLGVMNGAWRLVPELPA